MIGRLLCKLGRHRWEERYAPGSGAAVAITGCVRCLKVDVDGIRVEAWNRRIRRGISKALR
jgi:Prophage protein (DUF1660)